MVARDTTPLQVRIDPELRKRIDAFQRATDRNLTGTINLLLREGLRVCEAEEAAREQQRS
jgi:hypothetical protein